MIAATLQLAFDVLLLTLAAGVLIQAWREGELFKEARDRVSRWVLPDGTLRASVPSRRWYRHRLGQLLGCSFCLSYHIPFWLMAICLAPGLVWPGWLPAGRLLLGALAATRLSLLLNGSLPEDLRY